jgi:dolichol-phosphate mannosyltransferase
MRIDHDIGVLSRADARTRNPKTSECTLSVVVPVCDEAPNIAPLLREIHEALRHVDRFEVIFVDDGSVDPTKRKLARARAEFPRLRCFAHSHCCGQSAALRTGVLRARAPIVAILDGDGQNDPADIPRLVAAFSGATASSRLGMVAGERWRRRDNALRRLSSAIANGVRGRILGDGAADTGCGLKLFRRDAFLALPFFDHMHRFLPALMLREGYDVRFVPVRHRPRLHGRSKYGVWDRLWVGIVDLAGVAWLQRRNRARQSSVTEIEGGAT